ncbi:hypothetical protein PSTG_03731 [Puccinia striiformis f. sp. tritici PST-78]|uniref:Uncharacterized protein n=1 Tax=Puccinia striiformis f. sp. tritici PST-78 TaxID=1165861 RepID=A0A0L0VVX5_9BASI|nr:hypothetical protein PSTG_03731 [Puccinia striiformis f. sp. tritici PST-78]
MQDRGIPPHQARADLEAVKAQLEETKIVNQAIEAGSKSFSSTTRHLAADSSNFEAWAANIEDAGKNHIGEENFFTTATTNRILEKIGRCIFFASVDESLQLDVQLAKTCVKMHELVTKKFKTISQAAQMNTWHKFKTFNLNDQPSSAGIASKLRNLATEWKSQKLHFTEDNFLGFVLPDSVGITSTVAQDCNNWVKTLVQSNPKNPTPTFEKLVHLLEICRQQHLLLTATPTQPATPSIFTQQPSSVLQTTVQQPDPLQPFDQEAYLQGIHPDDWTKALNCYTRGPGTYSYRQQQIRQPMYNPAPFYPIVGAVYSPPGLPFPPHQSYQQAQRPTSFQSPYQNYAPPAQNNYQQPGLRPADSFKPEYSPAPPPQKHNNRSTHSGGGISEERGDGGSW